MVGPVEGGVQVATSFVDSLKSQPLSLALVAMNMALLAFFYVLLTAVSAQREREIGLLYADKKEVRELLAQCVVPGRGTSMRLQDFESFRAPFPLPRLESLDHATNQNQSIVPRDSSVCTPGTDCPQ